MSTNDGDDENDDDDNDNNDDIYHVHEPAVAFEQPMTRCPPLATALRHS